jgi:hypothetical protein
MAALFRANGEDLELPDVTTLTLDESIVLFGYSGLTLDQLEDLEGMHPGVLGGLVHVAVARANPDMKAKDVEKAVRKLNLAELIASFADQEEEVATPDLPKEPAGSSESSEESSGESSRIRSVPSPDEQTPEATGTPESDSSASDPEALAG